MREVQFKINFTAAAAYFQTHQWSGSCPWPSEKPTGSPRVNVNHCSVKQTQRRVIIAKPD